MTLQIQELSWWYPVFIDNSLIIGLRPSQERCIDLRQAAIHAH